MFPLRIDLQEGFDNDTVVITVNGSEVYRNSEVKTRLPVSVAQSFEIQVAEDSAHVEVDIPTKGRTGRIDLQLSEFPYLGVSVSREKQITFERSKEIFRYL